MRLWFFQFTDPALPVLGLFVAAPSRLDAVMYANSALKDYKGGTVQVLLGASGQTLNGVILQYAGQTKDADGVRSLLMRNPGGNVKILRKEGAAWHETGQP